MFANKNKNLARILISLALVGSIMAIVPVTHAGDLGQDFLAGIGCDDTNKDGGLNFFDDCLSGSDSDTVTSFTDFKGDLTPPNPEGYAAGLTQATDARTFILNVTNFALGFLGLIAVLVVIYGGVLSVTSAGNPDGYNKGKKAITFAAIGLLIVMSSFALVNTILLAPSGNERGSTATNGLSSTSIRGVASSQRFNYLANQIDDILRRVYSSYQLHFAIKQEIENTIAVFTGYDESTCFVPASNCANQVKAAFQSQFTILSNYLGDPNANAQLTTGMAAYLTEVQNEFNSKLADVYDKIIEEDCDTENTFIDGGNPCTPDNLKDIKSKLKMTSVSTMMQKADFLGKSFEEDMNYAVANTAQVFQAISGIASAEIGKPYFEGLIPTYAKNPAGTPPTTVSSESAGYFNKLLNDMKSQLTIGKSLANINQDQIKNVLKSLVEIKSILQNIKFVNTVISADVAEGNAPLIVNFSSVGTTDPSGLTVTNERLHWDLNGDGKFSGDSSKIPDINCKEQNGATASCIFSKPGTYRVSLKAETDKAAVNPSTGLLYAQEIAPGISYLDIKVNPPSTKIDLEVSASGSGNKKPILKYNAQTGTVLEDHSQVYFTLSQAKAGLIFDASKSTGPDGKSPVINDPSTKIRWNFGVPSEHNDTYSLASKDSLTINQVYPAIGNYQVIFEVTDKNGIVDRKIFTVVVSNVAPSITNPPPAGKVGDELTFDGSDSTSDGGPLIFNWTVEKITTGFPTAYLEKTYAFLTTAHAALLNYSAIPDVTAVPKETAIPAKSLQPTKRAEENEQYRCYMPDGKDDTLKCTFKKAGQYRVTLSLDDNGVARTESTNIQITSNAPTAAFRVVKLSESAPALYKLDASSLSFDPDEKDASGLEYSWEINPSDCTLIGYADKNTEAELIKASTDATSAQIPCAKLKDYNHGFSQPVVKFNQKGDYTISLVDRMYNETDLLSESAEQSLSVENVLDISWGDMKPSAILKVPGETAGGSDQLPENVNKEPQAEIKFLFNSSQAISYELDFGDGSSDSGEMTAGVQKEVIHNYSKTGKFVANLSVFDADDVENKLSRKIFIGDSDSPIAIISTTINGSEVQPQNLELEDGTVMENVIIANRSDNLSFDADKSINTDGTGRRLQYSWNVNNNEKQSTSRQVSHKFTQLSEKDPYVVKLKATNERDAAQSGEDSVNILVVGESPTIRSLTAVPSDADAVTPTQVKLTAIGAEDTDGQIVQYKWWYYDASLPASPDERKGLQITSVPTATLTLGTSGEEGQKKKYKFGVEMTDSDNITVSTDSQDPNARLNIMPPVVEVTNGPNKAPIARFTVDRSSINVGESVNFTSSSIDPDQGGSIKEYRWDFGDGTKGENKSSVSHTYQKANVDGYRAKLTVVDNNASEATSDVIRIFVDAEAEPPVAGFTIQQNEGSKVVKFTNTSTADSAAGASLKKYSWDFDISSDSNGDGKKDNDIDSGDANPSYTYPNFGIYRTKLTVEDNQGQIRSVTNFVNVKPPVQTKPASGGTTSGNTSSTGSSSSAAKTAGANLFEASTHVDIGLLLGSVSAYVILMAISRKKSQENKNKIN